MNPAGIAYFYLARDLETAAGEVVDNPHARIAISTFRTKGELVVLDLTRLPEPPSVFDLDQYDRYQGIVLLEDFVEQISTPVAKDCMEHIGYIPSQMVCEYFAQVPRSPAGASAKVPHERGDVVVRLARVEHELVARKGVEERVCPALAPRDGDDYPIRGHRPRPDRRLVGEAVGDGPGGRTRAEARGEADPPPRVETVLVVHPGPIEFLFPDDGARGGAVHFVEERDGEPGDLLAPLAAVDDPGPHNALPLNSPCAALAQLRMTREGVPGRELPGRIDRGRCALSPRNPPSSSGPGPTPAIDRTAMRRGAQAARRRGPRPR